MADKTTETLNTIKEIASFTTSIVEGVKDKIVKKSKKKYTSRIVSFVIFFLVMFFLVFSFYQFINAWLIYGLIPTNDNYSIGIAKTCLFGVMMAIFILVFLISWLTMKS